MKPINSRSCNYSESVPEVSAQRQESQETEEKKRFPSASSPAVDRLKPSQIALGRESIGIHKSKQSERSELKALRPKVPSSHETRLKNNLIALTTCPDVLGNLVSKIALAAHEDKSLERLYMLIAPLPIFSDLLPDEERLTALVNGFVNPESSTLSDLKTTLNQLEDEIEAVGLVDPELCSSLETLISSYKEFAARLVQASGDELKSLLKFQARLFVLGLGSYLVEPEVARNMLSLVGPTGDLPSSYRDSTTHHVTEKGGIHFKLAGPNESKAIEYGKEFLVGSFFRCFDPISLTIAPTSIIKGVSVPVWTCSKVINLKDELARAGSGQTLEDYLLECPEQYFSLKLKRRVTTGVAQASLTVGAPSDSGSSKLINAMPLNDLLSLLDTYNAIEHFGGNFPEELNALYHAFSKPPTAKMSAEELYDCLSEVLGDLPSKDHPLEARAYNELTASEKGKVYSRQDCIGGLTRTSAISTIEKTWLDPGITNPYDLSQLIEEMKKWSTEVKAAFFSGGELFRLSKLPDAMRVTKSLFNRPPVEIFAEVSSLLGKFDGRNFTVATLCSILTLPRDGKAHNYVVDITRDHESLNSPIKALSIVSIDNDLSLMDRYNNGRVMVDSILWLMPPALVNMPVDLGVQERLISSEPVDIILDWLVEAENTNREITNAQLCGLINNAEADLLGVPVGLSNELIIDVSEGLCALVDLVKRGDPLTLAQIHSLLEPVIARVYKKIRSQPGDVYRYYREFREYPPLIDPHTNKVDELVKGYASQFLFRGQIVSLKDHIDNNSENPLLPERFEFDFSDNKFCDWLMNQEKWNNPRMGEYRYRILSMLAKLSFLKKPPKTIETPSYWFGRGVREGNPELVRLMLETGEIDINAVNPETGFHPATDLALSLSKEFIPEASFFEVAKVLNSQTQELAVSSFDMNGYTPLHVLLTIQTRLKTAKFLIDVALDRGGDPDETIQRDGKDLETAMQRCCRKALMMIENNDPFNPEILIYLFNQGYGRSIDAKTALKLEERLTWNTVELRSAFDALEAVCPELGPLRAIKSLTDQREAKVKSRRSRAVIIGTRKPSDQQAESVSPLVTSTVDMREIETNELGKLVLRRSSELMFNKVGTMYPANQTISERGRVFSFSDASKQPSPQILLSSLAEKFIGFGYATSIIFTAKRTQFKDQPIQLTTHLQGESLSNFSPSIFKIDDVQVSKMILMEMLIRPERSSPGCFLVVDRGQYSNNDSKQIMRVSTEGYFNFSSETFSLSALYFLDIMFEPIPHEVVSHFSSLPMVDRLLSWLSEYCGRELKLLRFYGARPEDRIRDSTSHHAEAPVPHKFPEGVAKALFERATRIQSLITRPKATLFDVLRALDPKTSTLLELVSSHVQEKSLSPDEKIEVLYAAAEKRVGIIPTVRNQRSVPATVLKADLEVIQQAEKHFQENLDAIIHGRVEAFLNLLTVASKERALEKIDFSQLGAKQQKKILGYIGDEPSSYSHLTIDGCNVLDDKTLAKILSTHCSLSQLSLKKCPQLSSSAISLIGQHCSEVSLLEIDSLGIKSSGKGRKNKTISKSDLNSVITLKKLARLTVNKVGGLECFSLDAPALEYADLSQNPGLRVLTIKSKVLNFLSINGCTSIPLDDFRALMVSNPGLTNVSLDGCDMMQASIGSVDTWNLVCACPGLARVEVEGIEPSIINQCRSIFDGTSKQISLLNPQKVTNDVLGVVIELLNAQNFLMTVEIDFSIWSVKSRDANVLTRLFTALRQNACTTRMELLGANLPTAEVAKELAECIRGLFGLQHLNISHSKVGPVGLEAVIKAVFKHTSIESIIMMDMLFPTSYSMTFKKYITLPPRLTQLKLDRCSGMSEEEIKTILNRQENNELTGVSSSMDLKTSVGMRIWTNENPAATSIRPVETVLRTKSELLARLFKLLAVSKVAAVRLLSPEQFSLFDSLDRAVRALQDNGGSRAARAYREIRTNLIKLYIDGALGEIIVEGVGTTSDLASMVIKAPRFANDFS